VLLVCKEGSGLARESHLGSLILLLHLWYVWCDSISTREVLVVQCELIV